MARGSLVSNAIPQVLPALSEEHLVCIGLLALYQDRQLNGNGLRELLTQELTELITYVVPYALALTGFTVLAFLRRIVVLEDPNPLEVFQEPEIVAVPGVHADKSDRGDIAFTTGDDCVYLALNSGDLATIVIQIHNVEHRLRFKRDVLAMTDALILFDASSSDAPEFKTSDPASLDARYCQPAPGLFVFRRRIEDQPETKPIP